MTQKKDGFLTTKDLVLIGLMSAILCIVAPFAIPLPFSPAPITLATFILYLDAYILKTKAGVISCIIYLALGFVGLPVFSGFRGGFATIFGPTGGYLIGYTFLVFIASIFIKHGKGKKSFAFLGLFLGTMITYLFGTIWLAIQLELTVTQAFLTGVFPYLPGDFLKIVAAMMIGPVFQNRINKIR